MAEVKLENLDLELSGEFPIELEPMSLTTKEPKEKQEEGSKPNKEKKEEPVDDGEIVESLLGNTKQPKETTTKQEPEEEDLDYTSFYEYLKAEELADELDEGIDVEKLSMKDIKQAIHNKFDKAYQKKFIEEFTEFDDKTNGLLSHLAQGGTLGNFNINSVPIYTTMKESEITDDSKAEKIVRDYYKRTTKFSDKRIEAEIAKLKDYEELVSQAKEVLPELKEYEKELAKQKEDNVKRQKQEVARKQKEFSDYVDNEVNSTNDYIGIEITNKIKGKVRENISKQGTVKKINENWAKYLPKLVMLDELGILDGKTELLEKVYSTKATKEVTDKIKNIPFRKNGGSAISKNEPSTEVDLAKKYLFNKGYLK